MKQYQAAASKLMKRYSSIAALAPDLIPPLANHFKLVKSANKVHRPVVVKNKPRSKSGFPAWGIAAIVVISGALRGLVNQSDHSPSTPNYYYSPPSNSSPTYRPLWPYTQSPTQQNQQQQQEAQRRQNSDVRNGAIILGKILERHRAKENGEPDAEKPVVVEVPEDKSSNAAGPQTVRRYEIGPNSAKRLPDVPAPIENEPASASDSGGPRP
jgi:hypothetical protein